MASATALKTEQIVPDGSIYVGPSPETGRPLYLERRAVPLSATFKEASEYARDLDAQGHKDWRLPSPRELNMIFNSLALIGGFDETAFYWTAYQPFETDAQVQSFATGFSTFVYTRRTAHVCCVRG